MGGGVLGGGVSETGSGDGESSTTWRERESLVLVRLGFQSLDLVLRLTWLSVVVHEVHVIFLHTVIHLLPWLQLLLVTLHKQLCIHVAMETTRETIIVTTIKEKSDSSISATSHDVGTLVLHTCSSELYLT